MCFSATASFSAGVILIGVGALTLRAVRHPRELPLASISLFFGIQQSIEGVIWLTFSYQAPWLNGVLTHLYSFFSHVLWPVYVPVAVLLIEPSGWRRKALGFFAAGGFSVGAYLMYALVNLPIVSRPTDNHIEYAAPHFFAATVMSLYLLSTTASPIFSSYRWVRVFGVMSLLAFGAAYYFYAVWFISVWCFFAAILSGIIYLHFAHPFSVRPKVRI
jgi:hypothetical protein